MNLHDMQRASFQEWVKHGHPNDSTLYSFPGCIDHPKTIVDLGGYIGDWARKVSDMYASDNPTIHVAEPLLDYCAAAKLLNEGRQNIKMHCVAVSASTGIDKISRKLEGSSLYGSAENTETIYKIDIAEFLDANSIGSIDIMKINVEGEEFPIIDRLFNADRLKSVNVLLLQPHIFVPDALEKYSKLHHQMSTTHEIVWQYPWIWECWARKKS